MTSLDDLLANLRTAADLDALGEDYDLEAKAAQGRDGSGEFPLKEALITYSAMANSDGGLILLGVAEDKANDRLVLKGLADPEKVRKELWDALANRQRVSANLLSDAQVRVLTIDGLAIIVISVPRATRQQRPIYVGQTPLGGNTYRRRATGDYQVDDESVRRMLAEQVEDARDARILPHHGLKDLDLDALTAYRRLFQARQPDHPWNTLDDQAYLARIGAWGEDREAGTAGLTLGGLLMFGQGHLIVEAVPHYFVDYQEQPAAPSAQRWIDRLWPDGSWSGNLFDFYRRVYLKLTADLKVPFALKGDEREEETPVHIALREALVNTLIHADFSGRISLLVIKRPGLFGFRNPGLMRVPAALARQGGTSDSRNRRLQKMFSLIGRGEQAGSGIPKILSGWASQHWRSPQLRELPEPEQTVLELHMVSLIPEEALTRLRQRFGTQLGELSLDERLALTTALLEGTVNHARMVEMSASHPHDLSVMLSGLQRDGKLESDSSRRGKVYYLPGQRPTGTPDSFVAMLDLLRGAVEQAPPLAGSPAKPGNSEHSASGSEHSAARSEHTAEGSEHSPLAIPVAATRQAAAATGLTARDIDGVQADLRTMEAQLVHRCQTQKRIQSEVMELAILLVCLQAHVTLNSLAARLSREEDSLRNHYLRDLILAGHLAYKYPTNPHHPDQAYQTTRQGGIRALDLSRELHLIP